MFSIREKISLTHNMHQIKVEAPYIAQNPLLTKSTPNMKLDNRDYIMVDDDTGATNIPGVYAGGNYSQDSNGNPGHERWQESI